jgi:hypothetical protein
MKHLKLAIPLLTLSLIALSGCNGQEESDSFTSDSQTDALESAITVISGQADDASGGSFAMQTKANAWKYAAVENLLYGSANAANCGRAYDQTCDNGTGVKTVSYTSCAITARAFTLNGSVTLTYSNNSCALGVGDNVVRTYDETITGPHGGTVQTTSALHSNYLGSQYSGGGRLTHTSATVWTMDILGKHKIGTRRGHTLFDVSAHTTTPISVSSTLSRSGRTISSGAIAIDHNLAKFTAVYSANAGQPLVWNSTCCHPVSGRLDTTYTGSITGSGSIAFNGCGSAELSKDGSTRTLSLGYCE